MSIDFYAFDFLIMDYNTKRILLRCNSLGPLYSFPPSTHAVVALHAFVASHASPYVWNRRLRHPSIVVLSSVVRNNDLQCSFLNR